MAVNGEDPFKLLRSSGEMLVDVVKVKTTDFQLELDFKNGEQRRLISSVTIAPLEPRAASNCFIVQQLLMGRGLAGRN